MRNDKKQEINRYEDDSFEDTDENYFVSNNEFGDLKFDQKYINIINKGISSLNNNFSENQKSDNKVFITENLMRELLEHNNNLTNNEFSRYNSRSYSNAELDYFSNKKIEMTDMELNCTNRFLNMSQFDQGLNITSNKNAKLIISSNRMNGKF